MIETTTNVLRDRSCWEDCQPFGAPSSTSEVSRVADFYRVECLTVFGTGRCEGVPAAELPAYELQAAA